MSNTTQTVRPTQPGTTEKPTLSRRLLSALGWVAVAIFVIGGAWGAGRGENKMPQVDVDIGRVQGHTATPALKKLAELLPQSVRKSRYRVRWSEVEGGRTIPCALHFDRNQSSIDLYRNEVWKDGYNDVNDTTIIIASRSREGLAELSRLGAIRSPQPVPGRTQL